MSSGFPESDAQSDFSRARRSRLLADIGRRLRREPDDVALMLPFEEVVEALGRTGQHDLGLQMVPLDAIVGSVDRGVDFDRGLRPTSARLRSRWERIAAAQRRGEALPPVSLYKIGDLYFVRDGHHRVSVAKSLGRDDIDAYVVEVTTRLRLGEDTLVSDLPLKDHERLFRERVPLPRRGAARGSRSATRGTSGCSPRRSRRGASARCRTAASTWTARGRAPLVHARSTSRSSSCCAPVTSSSDDETETEAYMRVAGRPLPRAAHARVERRGARAAAPRGAPPRRRRRTPPRRRGAGAPS